MRLPTRSKGGNPATCSSRFICIGTAGRVSCGSRDAREQERRGAGEAKIRRRCTVASRAGGRLNVAYVKHKKI